MQVVKSLQYKIKNVAILHKCRQTLSRVVHRGGHGVHSPFVYKLIRRVIEQPYSYYGYEDIKHQRATIKSIVTPQQPRPQSYKTAKLLFALISRYKPQYVLEIGTTYSLSNQIIQKANPQAQIITVEPDRCVLNIANQISPITNTIYTTSYTKSLTTLLNKNYTPQFIYIKEHNTEGEYLEILEILSQHIPTKSIIMIEGIRKTKRVYNVYTKLLTNPNIKVILDLYTTSLVISNPKLNKQRYKTAL